jgi:hypothetical protein
MLSAADTALDLLVLELVLELVLLVALLLCVLAPVHAGAEDDVLADRRSIRRRARTVFCTQAELAPCLAVGDSGVDGLLMCDVADAARGLYFLAILVDSVRDDGLSSILVRDGLKGWELCGCLLDIIVVGPIVPVLRRWWG